MTKLKGFVLLWMLCAGLWTAQAQTPNDTISLHSSLEESMMKNPFARKWELSAHGGWSYRIAKLNDQVSPNLVDYANRLRSGYHLGGGIDYFWREDMGIGLTYSGFGTKAYEESVTLTDPATGQVIGEGDMSDDIMLSFIAPSFNYRYIFPGRKAALQTHYAIGYLFYTNDSMMGGRYFRTTAQNFGISLGAHLDVPLSQRFSFMAGARIVGGSFGKLKVHFAGMTQVIKAEDDDQRENVSRIDLSAGLRFRL